MYLYKHLRLVQGCRAFNPQRHAVSTLQFIDCPVLVTVIVMLNNSSPEASHPESLIQRLFRHSEEEVKCPTVSHGCRIYSIRTRTGNVQIFRMPNNRLPSLPP